MKTDRHFLTDEQGNLSLARLLLGIHALFNWCWLWGILLGWIDAPTELVATVFFAGVDTVMFVIFGSWAAGPRGLQYLGPALRNAVGTVTARLRGMDNARSDDER